MITRQTVADKIADYLHRGLTVTELAEWAEKAMNEGELDDADAPLLASVVARLGVADVRSFGLTWEDCDDLLRELGYQARVDIVKV
jgi:cobyrinic acid a,c-diamide synthase